MGTDSKIPAEWISKTLRGQRVAELATQLAALRGASFWVNIVKWWPVIKVGKHPLNLGMTSRGYCWWLSNLAPGWLGTVVILADGPHKSALKVFAEQRSKRAIVYPMIYSGFIDVMQGF